MSNSMILHCGGYNTDREAVDNVVTPEASDSHFPLAHCKLIDETLLALEDGGLEIVKQNHALVDKPLTPNSPKYTGSRYFGLLDVRPKNSPNPDDDHGLAIGLRNTHDRSYAASLVAGTRVFVCDNLGFSGEVMLARRHTRFIERDLPKLVVDAFGKVIEHNQRIEEQIGIFKASQIDNTFLHDIVCKAVRCQAMPNAAVAKVLNEWYDPSHAEFAPRTAWSALNAFTEIAKEWKSPDTKIKRTMRWHTLLAQELGCAV